jgi:hypothetical protein
MTDCAHSAPKLKQNPKGHNNQVQHSASSKIACLDAVSGSDTCN